MIWEASTRKSFWISFCTHTKHTQNTVIPCARSDLDLGSYRKAAPPLIEKWEQLLGVKVEQFFVQRMKTKWGGCNAAKGHIRLNTELAKKPPECLEYIVVHEMIHLIEPKHNERFMALMDDHMPQWQHYRDMLNRLPVAHDEWDY